MKVEIAYWTIQTTEIEIDDKFQFIADALKVDAIDREFDKVSDELYPILENAAKEKSKENRLLHVKFENGCGMEFDYGRL